MQPPGRFGAFTLAADSAAVSTFTEKPRGDGAWINGGFFVLEPKVLDYIEGDPTVWEQDPMRNLAHDDELRAYRHTSFWQSMDTLRDKQVLQKMWDGGDAPWVVWGQDNGSVADQGRRAQAGS